MTTGTRVFSDATQNSQSGCKKLGKHGSRKGAVRRWALENKEAQQGSHGLFQRKYAWNEKNLLKESSDSRHTVFYRYGADGQRALKSSEQSETLYFNTMWSWMHNSSAYNTDREIKHIYLGSERLVTRTNGAGSDGHTSTAEASTYYYHSDHLGSAHLITDYKGDEYERVEYTPYGEYWIEKRAPENRTLPFKFTGKERDEETGLYYYGARYLDAKTSRWLTADPALSDYIPMAPVNDEAKKHNQNLPGMGGIYNTVNFHLYHYAGNNPVKYTDPDGRETYDSSITEEQYNKSSFLQRYMSWDNVQKYFEENPNGVLYRPEDQFSFLELESRKDIVDINSASMLMVEVLLIGRGLFKAVGAGFSSFGRNGLSKKLQHHILSRHSLNGLKSQYGKAPLQKLLGKTIFNPKWSDKKILRASQKAVQQALKNGVTNGSFTTTVYGETVTAAIENGVPQTVYGAVIVTAEMLK